MKSLFFVFDCVNGDVDLIVKILLTYCCQLHRVLTLQVPLLLAGGQEGEDPEAAAEGDHEADQEGGHQRRH